MEKEQPRDFSQHMAMDRCDLNSVVSQCSDHRIDFLAEQYEIACNRTLPTSGRFKVNSGREPHRGRHLHAMFGYRFGSWKFNLVNAIVVLALFPKRLVNLCSVNIKLGLFRTCCIFGFARRLCDCEGVVQRFRQFDRLRRAICNSRLCGIATRRS